MEAAGAEALEDIDGHCCPHHTVGCVLLEVRIAKTQGRAELKVG